MVDTAGGWPAIVGLAARTARAHVPTTVLPRRLYDFLADDLIRTASPETREALTVIAVAGTSDRRLVAELLGDLAERALLEADSRGLITLETDEVLGLHPLLREFLVERVKRDVGPALDPRWRRLVDRLADLARWDECLSVIEVIPQNTAVLTQLIERSLEDLLVSGHMQSVQRWIDLARLAGVDNAALDLADAEVALRRGDYDRALSLGGRAADMGSGDTATRARLVAARAAHLSDRTATAASFFEAAGSSAETVQTRFRGGECAKELCRGRREKRLRRHDP